MMLPVMVSMHLPVLPVVLPLMVAAFVFMLRKPNITWLCAVVTCALLVASSAALLLSVQDAGPIRYIFGGFAAPYGIEYHVDVPSAWFLVVVNAAALLAIIYGYVHTQLEIPKENQPGFYSLLLLCLAGLNGILLTHDVFHLYVCLEISSLATYALIAMGRDKRALVAAYEYLILGSIGATFYLIAVGFLYITTGTLNMDDLAQRLPEMLDNHAVQAALIFLVVGILLKVAAFPLHIWLTNAYVYAPTLATVFLAAVATKVSIYILLRILVEVYGIHFVFTHTPLPLVLQFLGAIGIVAASIYAVMQVDARRMLAFSSVAQMGYILLGIGIASDAGVVATLVHVPNHAMAKALLFMAVGAVYYRTGGVSLLHMAGIARQMPITLVALVVGSFSIIGVPGTAGFISKWMLVQALIAAHLWWAVAVVVIGSLLAMVYLWKILEVACFMPPTNSALLREVPLLMLVPILLLIAANIMFGFHTEWTAEMATRITQPWFHEGTR